MDKHDVVQCMLTAGKKYSISTNDLRVLLLKLVVLSVKYVSKQGLWAARFEATDYVDWDLVESQPQKRNILGGCKEWMGLLSFCNWEQLIKHESMIQTQLAPLQMLRRHIRESNLDTGDKDAWTVTCKIFLLMLVQGLPSLHALENLTCSVFRRDTQSGCMALLAKQVNSRGYFMVYFSNRTDFFVCVQAEHLFTPQQYEATLQFVLDKCDIDVASLDQIHTLIQATLEDRRLSLKLSRMTVIQGRPRLRDLVSRELKTEERKAQVDTLLETWESYTGFCYKHQFPPTLSERIKSRLYFLASQSRWDWPKFVAQVLPAGGPILDKVVAHPITQPDLPVILRVLEALSMDGSAPFAQMTEFRRECFQSFPVTHVQRMTLSQVSVVTQ